MSGKLTTPTVLKKIIDRKVAEVSAKGTDIDQRFTSSGGRGRSGSRICSISWQQSGAGPACSDSRGEESKPEQGRHP